MIEREALDKVIKEQNISLSDRFNPDVAVKIGGFVGADAVVIGKIMQFRQDEQDHCYTVMGHKIGRKSETAVVQITARLVSTSTAQVLGAADGKGNETRSETCLSVTGTTTIIEKPSSDFSKTVVGEAVTAAIGDTAKQLEEGYHPLPPPPPPPTPVIKSILVSGKVYNVSSNTLIMNVGTKAGVKVGDHLSVFQKHTIPPPPGETQPLITYTKLGDVTITEAEEDSSTGTFSGTTPPKPGDIVKTVQ